MRNLVIAIVLLIIGAGVSSTRAQVAPADVKDLTLLVSRDLPCVWPVGMTPFAIVPTHREGSIPRDMLIIDEHTGTQWDAPAHFVPPPDSGLPGAGPNGLITNEKVPAWQFVGEACVIDVSGHCDDAESGASFLIGPEVVRQWEREHRRLRFGDVVLFKSGYSDKYYKPFPEGNRFVAAPLRKETPGWPAPKPETMAYLRETGVMTLGLDGASMGPLPDLAVATHQAGGSRGMIWVECATNLGALPGTGAFFAMLPAKHAGGSGGECRCLAITEPTLAARLIESARRKRVADLSVTLDDDLPVTWPGYRPGEEASRYVGKTLNAFDATRGPYFARMHLMDSQAGTHVVLPGISLPVPAENPSNGDAKEGERKQESRTIGEAPLERMMGPAHLIDARSLVGTTKPEEWPASPLITLDFVKQHEAKAGRIQAGEVVIFFSGYTDVHFKPLPAAPELDRLMAAPLAGKAEGWPAPTPPVIDYLARKGVLCVATDGPTLGGAHPEQSLATIRRAAARGMHVVEFLTGLSAIEGKEAFFLFAPVKIEGLFAGYGRAIALY